MDHQLMIEVNRREAREEGLGEGQAKGEARGLAKGVVEGEAKAQKNRVRRVLEKLLDLNKAADLLGLDQNGVRRLAVKFGLAH